MVNKAELPAITWEENFGPEEDRRVSDLIVSTITAQLASPLAEREWLFFIVPTPSPYEKAEVNLLSALGATVSKDLRVVTLPRGGRCYMTTGEERFGVLLPHIFHMGPPELTLIAANCGFDLTATEDEIAKFVLTALKGVSSATPRDVVGMHFDSGDLVELF